MERRPGGRLRGRGERGGQSDPGPHHGGAGRNLARVRFRRAQGVRDTGALRGPAAARAVPGAPVLVRQRGRGGQRGAGAGYRRRGVRCGRAWTGPGGRQCLHGWRIGMSAEDLEKYETEMELQLYREYRDIVRQFSYVVETERRFYLANQVDLHVRNSDGEVYFEVEMQDAWVWDMYRPARFVKNVPVMTFKDVNVEELGKPDISLPTDNGFGS